MEILLQIFVFIYFLTVSYCEENCHEGIFGFERYLGSQTPYKTVMPEKILYHTQGCLPKKMIGFIRQGSRMPSLQYILEYDEELQKMRSSIFTAMGDNPAPGQLCESVLNRLAKWDLKTELHDELLHVSEPDFLTAEERQGIIGLALRLQRNFPEVLPKTFSNASYHFQITGNVRAEKTAIFFSSSLFSTSSNSVIQIYGTPENDSTVMFPSMCEKYKNKVLLSPTSAEEYYDFVFDDQMTYVCSNVSKRLGLTSVMSYDNIEYIYNVCGYETLLTKKKSPWCLIFSEQDLKLLEYGNDLWHYWFDGYGHPLNYKIACPALKAIVAFLGSQKKDDKKAMFYFVYPDLMLKILAHLGLYKDTFKLIADLSPKERESRLWKTSYINAYTSNLVFISYKCGRETKVLTLHQEKPVHLPGCPADDLCPLTDLMVKYRSSIYSCDLNKLCNQENNNDM